jgi:hypothetical protein
MAIPPEKDPASICPHDDAREIAAGDFLSVIPKGVDNELAERLARWLKREITNIEKPRA